MFLQSPKLKLLPPRLLVALVFACASFGVTVAIHAQSRIISPQPLPTPAPRRNITTVRSSDSSQGSRVTISSNQSLMEYEAFRQGDKFYLRIPAAEVPRVEAVRGRGFADVTAQRNGDKTLVSFRLRPGATAHVEQRGNNLDVVINLPGASGQIISPNVEPSGPSSIRSPRGPAGRDSNAHANVRDSNPAVSAVAARPEPTVAPRSAPNATPKSSPATSLATNQKSGPSPTPTAANQTGSSAQTPAQNTGPTFRQRVRYWILLAQLNPIPVAIGAAVLLFLIGMLIFQRKRARSTRRTRSQATSKKVETAVEDAAPNVAAESVTPADVSPTAPPVPLAVTTAAVAAETATEPPAANPRHQRVTRVSDEVKKLMAGGDYDQSIVASGDRETRQLVGAELLSALVGRNLQRRERARAAFMKHGYFDDATRDLRIGDSPNERAAAARRLSFVHDREATPHLIAALDDSSPDVRRASVEALMDLRDPAAIAPLNSLMQTENDRKVPRTLIKHAIEACAIAGEDDSVTIPAASSLSPATTSPMPTRHEIEREVIEI